MKRSYLLLMAVLGLTALHAQTADEIISKYIDAIGGKTVLSSIKSLVIEGKATVQGSESVNTTYLLVGQGYKSETNLMGQKVVQCITPGAGWGMNPFMGQSAPVAADADAVKNGQIQLQVSPLINYAAHGSKVEFVDSVSESSAIDSIQYRIRLTNGKEVFLFYINRKSHLLDMTVMSPDPSNKMAAQVTSIYKDYRKTDYGYVIAFDNYMSFQTAAIQPYGIVTNYTKVTVNAPIDPAIFKLPKK
jgi:hypothetical protein